MESKHIKIKIPRGKTTAFAWKFDSGLQFSSSPTDYKRNVDINIGIDKSNRKFFLQQLEYLTRDNVNSFIELEITELFEKMPRHLDNALEYINGIKRNFSYLQIIKVNHSSLIEIQGDMLIFKFSEAEIFKFFTKLYINFEIYATVYDNILPIKCHDLDTNLIFDTRLVIWGVVDNEVIYY